MKTKRTGERGMSIIEVLLSIAVALVFITGINQLVATGIQASNLGKQRSTAAQLASEGLEAMYSIRENDGIQFTGGWAGLTAANEYYQPTQSGGTWNLGSKLTANPPPALPSPFGQYTRTVKIEPVQRASGGFGCNGQVQNSGACTDNNTRKITVTVTWYERGVQKTHREAGLLTNI